MYILNLSEAEIQELRYERFHYPCPLVQKRMQSVYLRVVKGYSSSEISKILDRHPNSITNDIKCCISEGIAGLKRVNYGTNKSALESFSKSICDDFKINPPHSIKEAQFRIEQLTGIRRSERRIAAFMKRIGMKRLKTSHIPAKVDTEEQKQWLEDQWEPVYELAKQGKVHLFFIDAVHFLYAPFLCFLWCFQRVFVKAPAGRKRVNILGALNAITKKVHFKSTDDTVNKQTIVDFLYQLRIYYHDMKPIYIVLDNARYHHAKIVRELAEKLNIKLLYLPPYSPNLNIIERLWKFLKKKCLYGRYYDSFEKFKLEITNQLEKINNSNIYTNELVSLLSLNFQMF